jgi:hypothetical protein
MNKILHEMLKLLSEYRPGKKLISTLKLQLKLTFEQMNKEGIEKA